MAFYMEHGKQQFQWTNRQTVSQNGDIPDHFGVKIKR